MSLYPRFRGGPLCPVDPAHGRLVDWPSSTWGFHCPHQAHDVTATRSFFTTEEAEAGSLAAEPVSGADLPASHLASPVRVSVRATS